MSQNPAKAERLVLEETDSTNAEAVRRIGAGLDRSTWILSRRQTQGRGRQGRSWVAPEGNLSTSLAFRPGLEPRQMGLLSFVTALAVADLLTDLVPGAQIQLKWPNDALLNGRKAAGILLEAVGSDLQNAWLVIGIGVNLVASPSGLQRPQGVPIATDVVAEGGRGVSVEEALGILASAFAGWFARFQTEGFAPIREAWMAQAARLGEPIGAALPKEHVEGIFEDVDADGQLVLRTAQGLRRISAADIYFPE